MRKTGLILLFLLLLTACGKEAEEVNENRVEINQDGVMTVTSVDHMEADYFDARELRQMVEEEIAAYAPDAEEAPISIKKCSASGERFSLIMRYDSYEDYCAFNDLPAYYGTLELALQSSVISGEELLWNPDRSLQTTAAELADTGSYGLFVFAEASAVEMKKPVLYHGGASEMTGEGAFVTEDSRAYFIFAM